MDAGGDADARGYHPQDGNPPGQEALALPAARNRADGQLIPVAERWLRALRFAAFASLASLLVLCFAWELWLAPLRPGGSLLALKAAPLALPLAGIFSGRRYTYQWTSLLVFAYFAEGVMRAWSETGVSRALAGAEIVISLLFLGFAVSFVRLSHRPATR